MNNFIENIEEAISEELSILLNRSALTKKCILMTFIGAGIGDVCIYDSKDRHHLAPNVAKIEPLSEYLSLKYMLFCLMSPLSQNNVDEIKKAVAQPSLSMETIRNLLLPLPPLAEQQRIVAKIEELLPMIDKL